MDGRSILTVARYGVGIPTRGRPEMLEKCLEAIARQTLKPSLVIVVDNNDVPSVGPFLGMGLEIEVVRCDFALPGPEQGHQTALRILAERGFGFGVRWDDDLIPERECFGLLVKHVLAGASAAGGMYPKPGDDRRSGIGEVGDGNPRHLQFFRWEGAPAILTRDHLYSSFAYRVQNALLIGGFCVEYSRFGQGGETDMSRRLGTKGLLVVDTSAVAEHHWSPGGRRDMGQEEMAAMAAYDASLYHRRMLIWGMDPEY